MRSTGTVTGAIAAMAMILAGGLTAMAWAQDTGEHPPAVVMGEVVVTASRQAETVTRVPAHVTVITGEDIGRTTAQNVPELLAVEGIHVTDVTGNKRTYWVDLRGFGESAPANLLVLVDGRRINMADQSYADWTLIPLERIERIEVVRGGRGGVLYGDNASGGVINIITKEAYQNQVVVDLQYGSYDTFKGSASLGLAGDLWSANLSGAYFDTEGYRDNSDSNAKDLGLNTTLEPLAGLRLNLSSGYHKSETGLPGALLESDLAAGMHRRETKHPNNFNEVEDYYAKAGMELDILSNDLFRFDASYRKRKSTFVTEFEGLGLFESATDLDTYTLSPQVVFQENFGPVANRIVLGYDYIASRQDIAQSFELERTSNAFYVVDDLQVTKAITLSGGYRYENARYKFKPSDPDFAKFNEAAYNAGINYAYGNGSKLYASYAKSRRYPLLDEIYFFTDTDSINPELKPQSSDHYEIGMHHVLNAFLGFGINLFQIKTKDEIFYNPFTGFFGMNENLDGDTIRRGAEVTANLSYAGFYAKASYTYMYAKIDGGEFNGNKVPNVPEYLAAASIGYQFDFGTSIHFSGTHVGRRPFISDFENAYENQKAYTVLNAQLRHDWRYLTFYLNANNLMNEKYNAYGGISPEGERGFYPSPEFNILAGVSVRFGGL